MLAIAAADELQVHHVPAAGQVQRRPNVPLIMALARAKAVGVPAWAIAAQASISASRLSLAAHGRVQVTPQHGAAIARALGMAVSELFPEVVEQQER